MRSSSAPGRGTRGRGRGRGVNYGGDGANDNVDYARADYAMDDSQTLSEDDDLEE